LREIGRRFDGDGQLSYFGAIVRPVRALGVSPDGRTVALGDSDGSRPTLTLLDARTHRLLARTVSASGATADVPFTPGRPTLLTGEAVTGRHSPPPEVVVLRRSDDGAVLRQSQRIPGGRLIGYTGDGRFVLVTSRET